MPQITILPPELRNKIAAGEVIERPASVAKELIENAIDAAGTEIRIEILRGGKGLIKVSDNGTGMGREDALLCILPHATSKLKTENALFDIRTMGFRGEALASIAAVSRMRLITGLRDSLSGVMMEVQGGEVKEMRDSPAIGTTVEVRDIFFNTPARRKFLKSEGTELLHIIDTITKLALSHWETGFRLLTDTHETMNLPRALDLRERIMQIYGHEFLEGLLRFEGSGAGITMEGFVSKGTNFRNSRSHQFICINRRPVRDQTISYAVYKAYQGLLPQNKHPVFFLSLSLDPRTVDFNVHPAKREVRFENKEEIFRVVHSTLRKSIREERTAYSAPFAEAPEWAASGEPATAAFSYKMELPRNEEQVSEHAELSYQPVLPCLYLGDTFVATAGKGGLTLIDHHAAHERILYEHFLKGIRLNPCQLLFPRQVRLSHKEYTVILTHRDLLHAMGIDVDEFGHDTVIVRSIPESLDKCDLRGILADVAAAVMDGVEPQKSLKEEVAARIACHSSVRGKALLSQEELQRLLSDLEETENPDQCPHGRPTRIFFTLEDLKKMFKRK
jgi:DNA mismatch repair protein MutL